MTTRRIQRKRMKGWRMPPNTVCVTRPGKWGNPYALQRRDDYEGLVLIVDSRDGTIEDHAADEPTARAVAIELFRSLLLSEGEVRGSDGRIRFTIDDVRRELRGKNLACFCPEGMPCHGDVLLELAGSDE